MKSKVYLGDSVYAEHDGFGIKLTTENGRPTDPSNSIYMEPQVLAGLMSYMKAGERAEPEKKEGG